MRFRIIVTSLGSLAVAGGMLTAPPCYGADAASQVAVAAVTAALTAAGTWAVKDYFETRRENERIQRETDDLYAEIARLEKAAAKIEAENDAYIDKLKKLDAAAAFYQGLIQEDEEFFKPPRLTERTRSYERALELLYVRNPEIIEKINVAMTVPAGEWERAVLLSAYGAGIPNADFWEIKRRMETGLTGGVIRPAGEKEARYVSGAENLMAVVEYVRGVAGETYLSPSLQRLWRCTEEEVGTVLAAIDAAGGSF